MKKVIFTVIASLLIITSSSILFIEIAEEVWEEESFYIDEIANEILQIDNTQSFHLIATWITELGSVPFLVTTTIFLSIYFIFSNKYTRWTVMFLLVNMLGISAITSLLKMIFQRERPAIFAQFDGVGYSFPSGHTTGAIAFYGFCAYVVWRSGKKHVGRILLTLFLTVLAVMVALSRIMLGVHYFTDIIAGAAIATSWLIICLLLMEWFTWKQKERKSS